MTKTKIIETYHLSSSAILELMDELEADMKPVTRRSHAVPSMTKLLASG